MSGKPRFHLPRGGRSARQRERASTMAAWVRAVQEAQATRADLAVSVAVDGLALVDSRTTESASHEVSVSPDRQVTRCSCWQWKRNRVCAHAAFVAMRLFAESQDVDIGDAGARAVALAIVNGFIAPPPKAPKWQMTVDHAQEAEIPA